MQAGKHRWQNRSLLEHMKIRECRLRTELTTSCTKTDHFQKLSKAVPADRCRQGSMYQCLNSDCRIRHASQYCSYSSSSNTPRAS